MAVGGRTGWPGFRSARANNGKPRQPSATITTRPWKLRRGLMFGFDRQKQAVLERGLPPKRPVHPKHFSNLKNRFRGQASLQQGSYTSNKKTGWKPATASLNVHCTCST